MDEKITIQLASKSLKCSEKTIRRYIEKGILSTIKEGRRIYIPSNEIRELRNRQPKVDKIFHIPRRDKVVVDRSHYDGLLTRLGYLEKEKQLLLEYKEDLKIKNEELIETRTWLEESMRENKQAQEKISHLKSSSIFTLQKKDDQIEELEKDLAELRHELNKIKRRGLIDRILNK